MADRILLETGVDAFLLEDGSGVLLNEVQPASAIDLLVAAGSSATTGGTTAVTQVHALAAAAGSSATAASTPAITQTHALASADGSSTVTGSTVAITQTAPATDLAVASGASAASGSTIAIVQQHVLAVATGASDVAASPVAITQEHVLAPQDGFSATFGDAVTIPGGAAPEPPAAPLGSAIQYLPDPRAEEAEYAGLAHIATVSALVAAGYLQ